MSTSYYAFRSPITGVHYYPRSGNHVMLAVFVNHANCGSLNLRESEVNDVIMALVDDRTPVVIRTGIGNGKLKLEWLEPHQSLNMLVSERGEVITQEQLTREVAEHNAIKPDA
jgi:hypothetical protein